MLSIAARTVWQVAQRIHELCNLGVYDVVFFAETGQSVRTLEVIVFKLALLQ